MFHVKGDITCVQEIVCEPLLDRVLFVTCADDKIIKAIMRIALQNVPQNGHAADLDQGLWLILRLFGKACPITAGKNNNFHPGLFNLFFLLFIFQTVL